MGNACCDSSGGSAPVDLRSLEKKPIKRDNQDIDKDGMMMSIEGVMEGDENDDEGPEERNEVDTNKLEGVEDLPDEEQ